MKILATNDDGIYSPGLWAAVGVLVELGQVFVVAPDREQSGVGTCLTLHAPIRATRVQPPTEGLAGVTAYAVEGTPADSVILALEHLVGPVDLVVSGINMGSNLGEDILVSGTVGAGLQGYLRGIPSIAISVTAVKETRYDVAAALLGVLACQMEEDTLPRPLFLNVNVPNEPQDKLEGVQITHLGLQSSTEVVKEGEDGRRRYYWLSRSKPVNEDQKEGTDLWAVKHKRISITPLQTQLTATEHLSALRVLGEEAVGRLCPR